MRYSLRTMARNPAFAITAMLILALGIGGNSAIFTVIRAVLLRPLDYREPDRLVYFSVENARRPRQNPSLSLVQFEGMKASAKTFAGMGAYGRPESFALASGGQPEELKGARVSANFLEVLGVPPLLGRSFLSEEDRAGGRAVAMISARLWKRRFSGARGSGDRHVRGLRADQGHEEPAVSCERDGSSCVLGHRGAVCDGGAGSRLHSREARGARGSNGCSQSGVVEVVKKERDENGA